PVHSRPEGISRMSTVNPAAIPAGTFLPIREDWLARRTEAAIEPDLPIVDPHHPLWDRPGRRYLLPELLADLNAGHPIVAPSFIECQSMYRAAGPELLRPLGETEFVNGIAAMGASGKYGATDICAGIVGYADFRIGAQVAELLQAHLRAAPDR